MSWFSRSLTGLLQEKNENGPNEEGGVEFWDDPELLDSAKSVKEDLTEFRNSLTQSLWGVASFLAPPPNPQHSASDDSPVNHPPDDQNLVAEENASVSSSEDSPQKKKLSGIQNDFAELKGGFAKGLSRLSSVIRNNHNNSTGSEDGLTGLLKPLIDNVLAPPNEGENLDVEEEDASAGLDSTLPATIADGISRLASSLFPFVEESSGEDLEAPGVTTEVVSFARNISKHPETWIDFPLASDDDHAFELTTSQTEHAEAVERYAPELAALKVELCPQLICEERFWKIYFVILHSRLSEEDAALLSTQQVLEARGHLVSELRKEQEDSDQSSVSVEADGSLVVDKDAIESTVKLAAVESVDETEADEWLEEGEESQQTESTGSTTAGGIGSKVEDLVDQDDVSFSDLEDEDDDKLHQQQQQQEEAISEAELNSSSSSSSSKAWVELEDDGKKKKQQHERAGSNDWLTVDKDDVGTGN